VLNNLTDATPQDLQWNNLLNHLEEVLKADIHKEEAILIPAAEQLFSEEEAVLLGEKMVIRKSELEKSLISRLSKKVETLVQGIAG
jgi:hypothetical protein